MSQAICESGKESAICSKDVTATISRIGMGAQAGLLRRFFGSKISILHILGSLFYDRCTIRYP